MSSFVQKLLDKYLSRKLVKSYVVLILSYIALMNGKLSGQEWIAIAAITLGIYTYGNIKDKAAGNPTA